MWQKYWKGSGKLFPAIFPGIAETLESMYRVTRRVQWLRPHSLKVSDYCPYTSTHYFDIHWRNWTKHTKHLIRGSRCNEAGMINIRPISGTIPPLPNTSSRRGAKLKHRGNSTFIFIFIFTLALIYRGVVISVRNMGRCRTFRLWLLFY